MYEWAFSTEGYSIDAGYFSNLQTGELKALTIGLIGVSFLCIFGRPQSLGHLLDFSLGMLLFLISWSMGILINTEDYMINKESTE